MQSKHIEVWIRSFAADVDAWEGLPYDILRLSLL